MARYIIITDDGQEIPVDDYRKIEGGEIEYIEPYSHDVKKVKGEYLREARGSEKGFFHGLFQGPKFKK